VGPFILGVNMLYEDMKIIIIIELYLIVSIGLGTILEDGEILGISIYGFIALGFVLYKTYLDWRDSR
jgi:hypothetical protein